MKSTAHLGGHPIHPMLIPNPFALLSTAAIFNLVGAMTARRAWCQTARHMTIAGLGSALIAAVPGMVDYVGTVPPQYPSPAVRPPSTRSVTYRRWRVLASPSLAVKR